MTTTRLVCLVLAMGGAAHADFSFTSTRQGGPAMGGDQSTKYYYKGDKMMTDLGSSATIIDFQSQTITRLDRQQKTYTVSKFSDINDSAGVKDLKMQADFKETGQHKTINGFDSAQGILTTDSEVPAGPQGSMKVHVEVEMWVSPDVPGYSELEAFRKRTADQFPWAALTANTNANMRAMMTDMQKKMATMHGAPVLEIVRTGMGGGAPAISPQQQAQIEQMRAQMEAMQKQGGPQAAAAQQALARMNAMSGGGGGMEIRMESSGFSAAPIPDSVFAIPAGYQQK